MAKAWVVLTRPDGREVAAPTQEQLTAVLADLYRPQAEVASASLRFGYDDGLMYVIEAHSDGAVHFDEWSDRDCEIALAPSRAMTASQADVLKMWSWLAERQVARIRDLSWQSQG